MTAEGQPTLRIGELSRRTGLSPEILRAWERRYALLRPARTSGGFRLYSAADEDRVRRMRTLMAGGLGAAQAARLAATDPAPPGEAATSAQVEELAASLDQALLAFSEDKANAVLDRLFAVRPLEHAFDTVIAPALKRLGRLWAAGEVTVAQEHFASNLLRGRLLAMARGWDRGAGPHALLACAPGELHDIALIAFGVALRQRGWRVTYLGPDTPLADFASAARITRPTLAVIAATDPARMEAIRAELTRLAADVPLALAGRGATQELARAVGARHLADGAIDAARSLTQIEGGSSQHV